MDTNSLYCSALSSVHEIFPTGTRNKKKCPPSTTPMHMWYETKSGSSTIYRLKSYKIRIFTKILTSSSGRVLDIFKYDWLDANWKRNFWKESEKHLCKNICLPQIYKLNKVLSLGEYFHHFQYYFLLCNIPEYTKINHWMNQLSSIINIWPTLHPVDFSILNGVVT